MAKQIIDKETANLFGKDYVKILIAYLKKYDKKATSALINSIDYRLVEQANQISIIIEANDYLKNVDEGRKPGKYPPIKAIAKWAQIKGIAPEAVFPIARSIYKFGIKPTNVIQKTNKEFQTSQTLANKYAKRISSNIEDIVTEMIVTEVINKNKK
jgi:hypothetical protein